MRAFGTQHPTDVGPFPPDQVTTFVMTGGSSAQASDWLSSGSTAVANAAAGFVHVVRITPLSTSGAQMGVYVNLFTTAAAVPGSGTSVSSASGGVNHPVFGPTIFQVPGGSTGFSVAAPSSGLVHIEQWERA